MATISVNDFGTDQHGFGVEKEKGPKDQDVEFAFRFCMALKKRLGTISDRMVREFKISFYKYPFGGLLMKLKIGLSKPDVVEDFGVRFEMDCLGQSSFSKPEIVDQILAKNLTECIKDVHKAIQSRIDLSKKKQNELSRLLKEIE